MVKGAVETVQSPQLSLVGTMVSADGSKLNRSIYKQIVSDRVILWNLCCMVIIWMSASFNNYLIGYQLKYIQGDIFENQLAAQFSEIVAYLLSGTLLYWLNFKRVLIFAFMVGLSGMLALIIT